VRFSSSSRVTEKASQLGTSACPRFVTYPRSMIVDMVAAYVEGRPIPCSSIDLTREASVYRGGGLVSCPAAATSEASTCSPTASWGRRDSAASAS